MAQEESEGYLTVAFGAKRYYRLADNLARSLRVSSPGKPIYAITDGDVSDLPNVDKLIPLDTKGGGTLWHKLALDQYSPFERTMFIDSDCLVVRDLGFAWERLAGQPFAVVGDEAISGEWFGVQIENLRMQLGAGEGIPKFNSGLIYWERGSTSSEVFKTARSLWPKYREYGFSAFRSTLEVADEPLISLAMFKAGLKATPDIGDLMCTPIGLTGRLECNIFTKQAEFTKRGTKVNPAIVHFCGYYRHGAVYSREALYLRLKDTFADHTARRVAQILFSAAAILDRSTVWSTLRGAYRLLKGRRSDLSSEL